MRPRRLPLLFRSCVCAFALLMTASSSFAATDKAAAQDILKRFLKCWETGDRDTFASLIHPKIVFGYPGGRFDQAGLLKTFDTYLTQKKDIKIYFSELFVSDGKKHILTYQFAATDRATNQRFATGTGVIFEISEGKIIALREYWDAGVPEKQKTGELPLDEGVVSPWPISVWLRPDEIN